MVKTNKNKNRNKKYNKNTKKKNPRLTRAQLIKKINKSFNCNLLNLDMNLKKIGEGVSNYVLSGCLDTDCKNKLAFRIMGISNDYVFDETHPVNYEILVYHKINKLIDNNINPHAIYLYRSLLCNHQELFRNFDKSITYKIFDGVRKQEINKKVKILILEFAKLGTIGSFINSNINKLIHFKVLFFQVMSMIITLQYYIPNFIHGDLHSNNTIIQKDLLGYSLKELRSGNKKYVKYRIFEQNFYIPWYGFSAKIFDFDLSSSLELKNAKMGEKFVKIHGITNKPNPVFDYHLFLNALLHDKNKYDNPNIPQEVFDFFHQQVPEKYRGWTTQYSSYGRLTNYKVTGDSENTLLIPSDIQTPSEVILGHPFFDEFRKLPKDGKVIKVYNSKIPPKNKLKNFKGYFGMFKN